jgi:predicted dehydrogenase
MKPLRTGIIGCGRIARDHATHLAKLQDIQLVGFCDAVVENAITYNQQYAGGNGRVYENCAPMFDELDLDLVYICLPPFAHDNEVELACRHHVHFLIEKPIALTIDRAEAMAKQVKASGVKTQVGFMYRFGEAAQWLKRFMYESDLQRNGFMSARYACNSLHRQWWRDRSKSGGQLVEQVIHLLDMSRFFFGEPIQVYSMQDNLFHREVADYTVEDASATVIRFEAGAIAVIAATNGAIPNRWDYDWRIVLPGLTADFADANHAVFHHTAQMPATSTPIESEKDLYLAETLDLIAAIREDRPTAVSIEEGVRSLQLALTAMCSAEQNAPIQVTPPSEAR